MDKFYTNIDVAQQCIDFFLTEYDFEEFDIILEPSAGAGSFHDLLPMHKISIDLYPEHPDIIEQDFFNFKPDTSKRYLVIGNPPFGKNSSLAKKFFNKAATFASVIAFILPKTFNKISVTNQLDLSFHCDYKMELKPNSFTEQGKPKAVPCVFQIWNWSDKYRKKIILPMEHVDFKFVEKSEADFAIRRVGGLAGKVIDDFQSYAVASHYFVQSTDDIKEKLRLLYTNFQDIAKNTAGNPSLGKGELVYIYSKKA